MSKLKEDVKRIFKSQTKVCKTSAKELILTPILGLGTLAALLADINEKYKPYVAGGLGLSTLILGVKGYIDYRKCKYGAIGKGLKLFKIK